MLCIVYAYLRRVDFPYYETAARCFLNHGKPVEGEQPGHFAKVLSLDDDAIHFAAGAMDGD